MVIIPTGSFEMGSTTGSDKEKPAHHVAITHLLAMGKTEVTRGEFAGFVKETGYDAGNECWVWAGKWSKQDGYNWRNPGYPQDDSHPVSCLNWKDAKAYAEWLAHKTGKPYRLPSEAEWEYAARGNTHSDHFWEGDVDQACIYLNALDSEGKSKISGITGEAHNCSDGYTYTSPAGNFKPNPFGLYDMLGNVWEWVEDSDHANYKDAPADGSAWNGGGAKHILRGGSWSNTPRNARVTNRNAGDPAIRDASLGFRLVRGM